MFPCNHLPVRLSTPWTVIVGTSSNPPSGSLRPFLILVTKVLNNHPLPPSSSTHEKAAYTLPTDAFLPSSIRSSRGLNLSRLLPPSEVVGRSATVDRESLVDRVEDAVDGGPPALEPALELGPVGGREGPGGRTRDVERKLGLRKAARDERSTDGCGVGGKISTVR